MLPPAVQTEQVLAFYGRNKCESRSADIGHQLPAGITASSQRCMSPLCCQLTPPVLPQLSLVLAAAALGPDLIVSVASDPPPGGGETACRRPGSHRKLGGR